MATFWDFRTSLPSELDDKLCTWSPITSIVSDPAHSLLTAFSCLEDSHPGQGILKMIPCDCHSWGTSLMPMSDQRGGGNIFPYLVFWDAPTRFLLWNFSGLGVHMWPHTAETQAGLAGSLSLTAFLWWLGWGEPTGFCVASV
jgi:hypothetical protein